MRFHISVREVLPWFVVGLGFCLFGFLQPRGKSKVRLCFSVHSPNYTITSLNHGYFL